MSGGAAILTGRDDFAARWCAALSDVSVTVAAEEVVLTAGCPALVVVDAAALKMLSAGGLGTFRAALPEAKFIVAGQAFSVQQEIAYLGQGCAACCGDDLQTDMLRRIVGVVRGGGIWLSKGAVPIVLERMQRLGGQAMVPGAPAAAPSAEPAFESLAALTERELQVAREVARGASNKQIARELAITDRTVKAHLSAIFSKLGFSDRVQLALYMSRQASRQSEG